MTATFNPALTTNRDHIRLALGDTDTAAPLVDDATIDAMLARFGYLEVLAQLAGSLVTQFGQRPDEYGESGGVKMTWKERIQAWRDLASAARSGKIQPPTSRRVARTGIAIGALSVQGQATSTSRSDPSTPTLMEGFRGD